MSKVKAYLCSCIIKEHFGDIVEKVTAYLLENGYKSLKEICKNVKLTNEEVGYYSVPYKLVWIVWCSKNKVMAVILAISLSCPPWHDLIIGSKKNIPSLTQWATSECRVEGGAGSISFLILPEHKSFYLQKLPPPSVNCIGKPCHLQTLTKIKNVWKMIMSVMTFFYRFIECHISQKIMKFCFCLKCLFLFFLFIYHLNT